MAVADLDPGDYAKMQERVALICNLRNGPLPKRIAVAPRYLIYMKTRKWAWAYYDQKLEEVRFLEGYEHLIPHEIVHHLQVLNGVDPTTEKAEAQARELQARYWSLWPS